MPESIGKRIARLRQENGLTQQDLALRLAVSRVAISHFEMDLSIPSERTITLMAGIFKQTPHRLVEGTTYPLAKAERLPQTACCYTALEFDMALLKSDLDWLERYEEVPASQISAWVMELCNKWSPILEKWQEENLVDREKEVLRNMQAAFYRACGQHSRC